MDPIWHDAAARERFADDRRALLERYGTRFGAGGSPRPSHALRDLLRFLGFTVQRTALPEDRLALVDFTRRVVAVEVRPELKVKPGTDVAGVVNSSLAHELAHIRLHEALLTALGVRVTYHQVGRNSGLEAEADCYAAVFLVPRHALLAHQAMQPILYAQRVGKDLEQAAMWRLIGAAARDFSVTSTLLKNQLVALGLCTYDRAGREVHVATNTGRARIARARG